MKRTLRLSRAETAPIITLLSSSPAAVQKAVNRLGDWTSLSILPGNRGAAATTTAHHVIPWTVTTTACRETGVVVRWLTPSMRAFTESNPRHALLAIQAGGSPINLEARDLHSFLSMFDSTLSRTKLSLSTWFRRPIPPHYLLGASSAPLLRVLPPPGSAGSMSLDDPLSKNSPSNFSMRSGLKEVVIPLDTDNGDSSFLLQLSTSPHVSRPATGLYRLPGPSGLCLRPLPTGEHDRQLPPPSLIFHADNQNDLVATSATNSRGGNDLTAPVLRKIGHSGGRGKSGGQYRLESEDCRGLDVRLCTSHQYSSMFAEAHESLLAGSLDDLQSNLVLREGAQTPASGVKNYPSGALEGPRSNQGDCWVEFRASLRRPSGFFSKRPQKRTAKPPNLPYE